MIMILTDHLFKFYIFSLQNFMVDYNKIEMNIKVSKSSHLCTSAPNSYLFRMI